MDPIANKPNLQPTTTPPPSNDASAKSADPVTAKSIQQAPVDNEYSGYLGSAGDHFDFVAFAKQPEDLEGLLETLSIKLERTSFSLAKQDMKDYLSEVQRYNDAERDAKNLALISQESLKLAEGEIGKFEENLSQQLNQANSDKVDAQARIDQYTGKANKQGELAEAQADLALADGKISDLNGQLNAVNSNPQTKDKLRVAAMLIEGMGLTAGETQQLFSEVISSGQIPADMLGGIAGPDAKAAAEKANKGLEKLEGTAPATATDAVTLAAVTDAGTLTHPVIAKFEGMKPPENADIALQKILNGLYSNSESEENRKDLIDQIQSTIDVIAQRFSGKEEVDEDIHLEFRNKISI